MRVLVFGLSSSKLGGIETFLLNMNKNMDGDCIFDYVVNGSNCIHKKTASENGSQIFEITQYVQNPIKNFHELNRVIKKNRKTHSIAYFNLYSMVHMIPVILCKIWGYKIVFHSHNSNISKKNQIYRVMHVINKKIFAEVAHKRLTCASHAADFMFGHNHVAEMVFNAVDTGRFKFSIDDRNQIRAKYGITRKYVIGFVGRLSEQKNPRFVIEIFESFHKQFRASVLMMIGQGELKGEIEDLIDKKGLSEEVLLLGNQQDIEKYYSAMDAFVLPSLYEGLPVVLSETQASGLTSYVTKEAVTKETCIADGMVEYIPREASADAWADIIVKNMDVHVDRESRNEIVEKSFFNIKREALRLESILKGV